MRNRIRWKVYPKRRRPGWGDINGPMTMIRLNWRKIEQIPKAHVEPHNPVEWGPEPEGMGNMRRTNVLMVEDEVLISDLIAEVLSEGGFAVHTVAAVEEALRYL